MNDLQKVLVVDNGDRHSVDPLSAELAELGFSSVTTSFEAAAEVLQVIQRPSAILLKMPRRSEAADYASFLAVADTLKGSDEASGVPVIVWDRKQALQAGGISALLSSALGPQVLVQPEA